MGAEFVTIVIGAEREELQAIHTECVARAQYEDDHGGYTGTIAESPGLKITDKVFKSKQEAKHEITAEEAKGYFERKRIT